MKIVARTKNLIHSCLMLACTNALAQSTDQDVEEIIVVAHRLPVPSSKVASSVSVLTQEDIVGVTDQNNKIIGSIKPSKIIDTVFGGKK